MTKYMLVVFGGLVMAMSASVRNVQPEIVRPFLNTETAFLWGRPMLGAILISYASFHFLQSRYGQRFMSILACALLGFLAVEFLAPEYFGLANVYLMPLDMFCLAGGSVMAMLGALDLKTSEEPLPLRPWLRQRLALELQNLTSTRYRKLTT